MLTWLQGLFGPRPLLHEPRLLGSWKSDRDATVAYLKTVRECTYSAMDRIRSILGKLTITYDEETLCYVGIDDDFTSRYRVVAQDEESVTIEVESGTWPKWQRSTIRFVEDGIWVTTLDQRLWWYREKFVRVPRPDR